MEIEIDRIFCNLGKDWVSGIINFNIGDIEFNDAKLSDSEIEKMKLIANCIAKRLINEEINKYQENTKMLEKYVSDND
ncbi:hypothetical protein UFOVP1009_40 [uncultured Caudovirales phage]|uniref:Uncharacterized protein n=1 Tax=uncultured Caudovirales phage TaxID=2100421 RepID=A0A6J5Q415_9CAUD|nr:hypothetical protein UFOVP1009_40 [uncultured Caudovirales phage]